MNTEDIHKEFLSSINKTTLKFSDIELEANFLQERLSPLTNYPNILSAYTFMLLLNVFNFIEFVAFISLNIKSTNKSASEPYVYLSILIFSLLMEGVCAYFRYLSIIKGCVFLIVSFTIAGYETTIQNENSAGFSPLYFYVNYINRCIMVFITSLDISSRYTFNWISSCICCAIGLISFISLIHYFTTYLICIMLYEYVDELIFFDMTVAFAFVFLIVRAYGQEKADRFSFFSYKKQKEVLSCQGSISLAVKKNWV